MRSPIVSKELMDLQREMALARLAADLIRIHKEFNDNLARYEREIAGKVGPRGPKGDKGERGDNTPRKGTDYFTPGEIRDFAAAIEARIQVPKDGKDGADGATPVRGKDYWNEQDRLAVIKDVLTLIRAPKDGKDAVLTEGMILAAIQSLPEDKRPLTKADIEGYRQTISALSHQVGMRGGGDTIKAGTNVTVTTDSNGNKVISASGSGGVNFETPTGSGTSFTVANEPLYIIVNGVTYFEGHGYSYAALTITLDFTLETDGWIRSAYA